MVCLVPLINKDPLHHFTHTMKVSDIFFPKRFSFSHVFTIQVCYLNCVRILCKFGANPNCYTRSHLTPLHVLVFTASENISLAREEEKRDGFDFIKQLLQLLLQVRFSIIFLLTTK